MLNALLIVVLVAGLWYWGDRATWALWTGLDQRPRGRPFAWLLLGPGVSTHEAAHALAALGCGAGVKKFVPFHPQRTEEGWQFGYVQPGPVGWIGQGIIALAPLWLLPLLLYGVGQTLTTQGGWDMWTGFDWTSPLTWLWMWWLLSCSLANMPSSTDRTIARPLLCAMGLILIAMVAGQITGTWNFDPQPLTGAIIAMLLPQVIIVGLLAGIVRVCQGKT